MARQTGERIPLATLEDRYAGAVEHAQGSSRLGLRIDRAIRALIEAVARIEWSGELDGDQTGAVSDAVDAAIRETLIREIDSRGIAR